MSNPKLVNDHTPAFFTAAVAFLIATGVWNIANIWLLDISVQERYTIGMGIVCAMFATVVVSKVVRDKEEAHSLVNQCARLGTKRFSPMRPPRASARSDRRAPTETVR